MLQNDIKLSSWDCDAFLNITLLELSVKMAFDGSTFYPSPRKAPWSCWTLEALPALIRYYNVIIKTILVVELQNNVNTQKKQLLLA